MTDQLDFNEFVLKEHLCSKLKNIPVTFLPITGSTNDDAKKAATAGAPEGTLIVAAAQTAGRGRLGRSFYSPAQTGLYLSLILRPDLPPESVPLITPAAAVAVALTIETFTNAPVGIKWVNDIWIHNRKICGILTEASLGQTESESRQFDYAVLGIGINLTTPAEGFPDGIHEIADSLFGGAVSKLPEFIHEKIIAGILNHFWDFYQKLELREFLSPYREHLFFLGQKITVVGPNSSRSATALGVDRDFHLLVRYDTGEEEAVSTGEISIRLSNVLCL